MSESGILYIVYGEKSLTECKRSLDSIRRHMPTIPITLIADQRLTQICDFQAEQVLFKKMPEQWNWKIKVDHVRNLPYEKTIYLDTDTLVCGDISDLFSILDRVDIAVCHEPVRTWGRELNGLPDSFPMLNTGVIAFRKSKCLEHFFARWANAHDMLDAEKRKRPKISYTDQNSFRYALYNSKDVQLSILPPEYNCRVSAGFVAGMVKVLHAHADLNRIENIINASTGERLHGTIRGKVFFVIEQRKIRLSRLQWHV